ncbi:hypothetical protein [Natronomonas marina]|jgi:hypothetical protein|uniref:hypothetical protein n=1 Tax=Natronomonas marina TaxID=2961939 RepID=UPI0020C98636|nr:hypothetical protein [Natronomonas marina]
MAEGIHLPTAAGTLVGLAGAMHVAVGVDALATEVTPLSLLLVAWGAVALAGVAATGLGAVSRRTAYLGGIALLLVSLVAYVDVYALGLSESALGLDWQPPEASHSHGEAAGGHTHGWDTESTEPTFLERLASGHFALPSKIVELVALGLLAALLVRDSGDATPRARR